MCVFTTAHGCGTKHCTYHLGQHILRCVSKFHCCERENYFVIGKKEYCENILTKTISKWPPLLCDALHRNPCRKIKVTSAITRLPALGPCVWFGDLQVTRRVWCLQSLCMSLLRPGIEKQTLAQLITLVSKWPSLLYSHLGNSGKRTSNGSVIRGYLGLSMYLNSRHPITSVSKGSIFRHINWAWSRIKVRGCVELSWMLFNGTGFQ